eukprot:1231420-Amphidinium_carterae.1
MEVGEDESARGLQKFAVLLEEDKSVARKSSRFGLSPILAGHISLGIPVKPMLAKPSKGLGEVADRLGGKRFTGMPAAKSSKHLPAGRLATAGTVGHSLSVPIQFSWHSEN